MAIILTDPFIPKGAWRRVRGFVDHKKTNPGTWYGIDYGMVTGSIILCVRNGAVNKVQLKDRYAGNNLLIQLRDNAGKLSPYFVWYAHLSKIFVKAKQVVHDGEKIALSGATGTVTGPHLHFSLLRWTLGKLVPINPEDPKIVKWVIRNPKAPPYPPPKPKPVPKPAPRPPTKTFTKEQLDKAILDATADAANQYQEIIDQQTRKYDKEIEDLKAELAACRDRGVELSGEVKALQKRLQGLKEPIIDSPQKFKIKKDEPWLTRLLKIIANYFA